MIAPSRAGWRSVAAAAGLLAIGACASASAQAVATADATLDADSQAFKREALELERDLRLLETSRLYPAANRLEVFVATDIGAFFKLETLRVELDGKTIAEHRYSDAESAALTRGAAQQLHVGTTSPGAHQLLAVFTGRGPEGRRYRRGASVDFTQAGQPSRIDLRVIDGEGPQQPAFSAKVLP
ncbi:hypothetical protein [Hydrocarboniphaga effusa]|uniref:hypothetical protein n=1 Tax=Hydrocarboniphaga effusa TaxID=243629 RepID=UPI003137B6E0